MKNIFSLMTALIIISGAFAQENNLKITGILNTDQRMFLQNSNEWSWNENRLDLKLEKKNEGKSKFFGNAWLRSLGFPALNNVNSLYDKSNIAPYDIDIREAYVELYGFLSKNLDVKIGRQRIAWGTADKINPTDNLNSYDMEDIWDFGRHNGSDAIKLTYYIKDNRLEGVFIPFFRPANLPLGNWSSALFPEMDLPTQMNLFDTMQINLNYSQITDYLNMPKNNIKESSTFGLKYSSMIAGFDFSLSYVYGLDGLPIVGKNDISISSINSVNPIDMTLNVSSEVLYPRLHIVGFDFAGSIKNVGVWGELAINKASKNYVMTTNLPDMSSVLPLPSGLTLTLPDSTILSNEIYAKYVLGLDYTFSNNTYLNFQYLHGFLHERGNGNLNDYFIMAYEIRMFSEKFKFSPLNSAFVVSDWKNISNDYALVYMPEIKYHPTDNSEISIGVRFIEGKGNNSFASFKDYDELFFKLNYHF